MINKLTEFLTTHSSSSQIDEVGAAGSAGKFASSQVSRDTLAWIFVAQGFAILPLFLFLPIWLPLVWLCAVVIRTQVFRGVWPFPGNAVKLFFGLGGACGLYWSFGGHMGVEPMIGFLVLSFVLKLIELRKRTDVLIIIYIGFVSVGAQLLLSQTLLMSLYALCSCSVLLASLQSVFQHRKKTVVSQLRSAFVLILQSLPVMLILFLVLPRLGQLWAVPSIKGAGHTGFSESMSPGDFSKLIQSADIAFRADFGGKNIPPRSKRYWRGLVLDDFDGRRWQRFGGAWSSVTANAVPATDPLPSWGLQGLDTQGEVTEVLAAVNAGNAYRYSILMEPHNYQWLFVLMAPLELYSDKVRVGFNREMLAISYRPVSERLHYEAVSLSDYQVNSASIANGLASRNLRLPLKGNPQSVALARSWLESGMSEQAIVEAALSMYQASFTYTLQPPTLGANSVDEFLFGEQRGFCEHFASSFVFLMRAAGIPARVVVGYLGGEMADSGRHMVIRQSDAHAWAEVWIEGLGWKRVDPTAAVSPLRIETNLLQAIDSSEASFVGGALMRIKGFAWLAKVKISLETWDYLWQTQVLGFNSAKQLSFFQRFLGGNDPWRVAMFLLGGIGICLIIYYFLSVIRYGGNGLRPELVMLQLAFGRLAKFDVRRLPAETPLVFVQRLDNERPGRQNGLADIVELYYRISYEGDEQLLSRLQVAVRAFKPVA